jgi:hypothetical protein
MKYLSTNLDQVDPYISKACQIFRVIQSGEFRDPQYLRAIIVTDLTTGLHRYKVPIFIDITYINPPTRISSNYSTPL